MANVEAMVGEGPLPLTLSNALRERVAALPPEGGAVYFVNNAGSEDDALSCAARALILDLASERGFTVAIDRQGVNHAENFILRLGSTERERALTEEVTELRRRLAAYASAPECNRMCSNYIPRLG